MRGYDLIAEKVPVLVLSPQGERLIEVNIYQSQLTGKKVCRFEKMYRAAFYSQEKGWYIRVK